MAKEAQLKQQKTKPTTASKPTQRSEDYSQRVVGLLLVALGAFFLLHIIIGFDQIGKLWPLILVIVGLAVIFGGRK